MSDIYKKDLYYIIITISYWLSTLGFSKEVSPNGPESVKYKQSISKNTIFYVALTMKIQCQNRMLNEIIL